MHGVLMELHSRKLKFINFREKAHAAQLVTTNSWSGNGKDSRLNLAVECDDRLLTMKLTINEAKLIRCFVDEFLKDVEQPT